MQAGAVFPPLVVFQEGEQFWLAEGFHRVGAYTAARITEVPCLVHQGGLRDAILHSAGANSDHGVRRSNADKRRAVLMLLQDEEWAGWSDREIARRCAVGPDMVGRLRPDTVGERQYVHPRTGNVTRMSTGRIGRKAEAEPGAPGKPGPPAAPSGAAGNVVVLGSRHSHPPNKRAGLYAQSLSYSTSDLYDAEPIARKL